MATVLNGSLGYLYVADLATSESTGALTTGEWYKIVAKDSATSALPANLAAKDVFYNRSTVALSGNDAAKLMTLTKLAFVTDTPGQHSKEKFDKTVQSDDARSYMVSDKSELTGTVNGYFVNDDSAQRTLIKKFRRTIEHDTDDSITVTSPQTSVFHTILSRSESTAESKKIHEYKPMIIDSINVDKPMDGPQTFSFQYTEDGAEKPNIYILDN